MGDVKAFPCCSINTNDIALKINLSFEHYNISELGFGFSSNGCVKTTRYSFFLFL